MFAYIFLLFFILVLSMIVMPFKNYISPQDIGLAKAERHFFKALLTQTRTISIPVIIFVLIMLILIYPLFVYVFEGSKL